jgi:hypothetical protein
MKADAMTTTTAPWEILTGPGWQGIGWIDAIADADGRVILYAADWGFDDERRAAAQLAATAPTMLAALRSLLGHTTPEYDYAGNIIDRELADAIANAEAAIAKAEGRT